MGSIFFWDVDGREMDAGFGGRKGEDSGVMEISLKAEVLPGVIGSAGSCCGKESRLLVTSRRNASYGDGYSAKVAVISGFGGSARGVLWAGEAVISDRSISSPWLSAEMCSDDDVWNDSGSSIDACVVWCDSSVTVSSYPCIDGCSS